MLIANIILIYIIANAALAVWLFSISPKEVQKAGRALYEENPTGMILLECTCNAPLFTLKVLHNIMK